MMHYNNAISRATIEQFLHILSQFSPKYGRIFLAGEAATVHLGLRPGTTMDLDIVVDAVDEDTMLLAIQRAMAATLIHVKLTSPEDSIPVPRKWDTRAKYIATYAALEVYYFDLPSIVLHKILLNAQGDINDALLYIRHGIVTINQLDDMYLEVQPHLGKRPYEDIDRSKFVAHYSQVRKWLAQHARIEALQ